MAKNVKVQQKMARHTKFNWTLEPLEIVDLPLASQ